MERVTVKVTGVEPMLMHNNQAVDPLNPYKKAIEKFTGKRKKTDDDHLSISRIEWEAGLYFNKKNQLGFPAENILRMILDAARKNRNGVKVKEGLNLIDNFILLILKDEIKKEGNEIPNIALDKFFIEEYFDRRTAKIQKNSVIRTRPRFNTWELEPFTIVYDSKILNMEDIEEIMTVASSQIGIGDFRPRYGRFDYKFI